METIVTPAAACTHGIMTKPTQAVFVLSAKLRCYPLIMRGLQNPLQNNIGVYQVIPSGGILGLAHRIQPVTVVRISWLTQHK